MGIIFPPKSESKIMRDFYYSIYELHHSERDNKVIELYESLDSEIYELEMSKDDVESDGVYEAEEVTASLVRDILALRKRVPGITKVKLQDELGRLADYYG